MRGLRVKIGGASIHGDSSSLQIDRNAERRPRVSLSLTRSSETYRQGKE